MGVWSVSNGPIDARRNAREYGAAFATPKKEIVDGRETYVIEMSSRKAPMIRPLRKI
jgi:hypothetical protein